MNGRTVQITEIPSFIPYGRVPYGQVLYDIRTGTQNFFNENRIFYGQCYDLKIFLPAVCFFYCKCNKMSLKDNYLFSSVYFSFHAPGRSTYNKTETPKQGSQPVRNKPVFYKSCLMFPEQETVEEGGTLLEHKKIFDVKFYSYILEYINIYY